MLAKFYSTQNPHKKIILGKEIKGEDASLFGAFSSNSRLCLYLLIPRSLGITYPTLRIARDGEEAHNISMEFSGIVGSSDRFEITLDMDELCQNEKSGLFYYDFIFPISPRSPQIM